MTNCGLPDGVVHPHVDRCYRAGVADVLAIIDQALEAWGADADNDNYSKGQAAEDLRETLHAARVSEASV